MKHNFKKIAGFTLIEIIIYIAIVTGVLVMASNFTWNIIDSRTKSQASQEVQQNARFIMERLIQEIQAANDINLTNSTFGVNPGKLSLVMKETNSNPTVFDVQNYFLRIKQGAQSPYELSSNQVKITNLIFTNLSTSNNKTKNIKINLTVEYLNPSQKQERKASTSLETTVELRDR